MRTILTALAIATLATPAAARQQPASDGYTMDRVEWRQDALAVRIVTYPSFKALREAMPSTPAVGAKVKAWSTVSPDGRCTIHVIDQTVSYTPDALGHELAHCMHGRWH